MLKNHKIVVTGGTGRFAKSLKKIKCKYKFVYPGKKLLDITNLKSISDQGLKCHNDISGNEDISNPKVNILREREIKSFGSLHDYVPLYFNPRNAMLYQTCINFKDEIIILEIKKEIITKNNTLFSRGNAAKKNSYFTHCKIKVA